MKKLTSVLLIALTASNPLPAFAQMSTVQREAERELMEIDCEILTTSSDVERIGNELRAINNRLSANISATSEATAAAVAEAKSLIGDVAEAMVSEGIEIDLSLPSPKKGSKLDAVVNAVAPAYRALKRLDVWETNVEIAYGIIATEGKRITMISERNKMIATSKEIDQVMPQLDVARSTVRRLSDIRKTKEAAFTAKGADVEGRYFGEACKASTMDGIWRTNFSPGFANEADIVEIRGTSVKYTSGTSGVTDECGILTSTLSFANNGSAEAVFSAKCKGSHAFMYVRAQFQMFGSDLHRNMCQSFSYKPTTCDLNGTDGVLEAGRDPLTKVAD
jgi:DNA-binding transcriptional regulator YhcF (GntR family)